MDDTAVRAARMMNSQSAMLRRRMETSRPQHDVEEGAMLFKRTVQMPATGDLQALLERWNPGVPSGAMTDLMGAVCRWNQLKSPDAVKAGQQLLIPTVIPHGQEPSSVMHRSGAGMRWSGGPARSPGMALSSQIAEQRTRSIATNVAGASTIWATGNQSQNLAGAGVKQQFQANMWTRRG